ncbi:unnamed protein product [Discula destructiva]
MPDKAEINYGEIRVQFEVVIAGSNLYNKDSGILQFPGYIGPLDVDNNAAFEVPLEPVGGYETVLSREAFEYNSTFKSYDASLCASICNGWTQRNMQAPDSERGPFRNGAFPVCTMFVAFELRQDNQPVAMVCDSFSSVWSHHYQSLRALAVEGGELLVIKVSAYHREDYQYPAICALKDHCKGEEFYLGGDCSGWGLGKCQHQAKEALPLQSSVPR